MTAKLYVGNLNFSIDNDKLREVFEEAGPVVSAKVMTEGPGGRSKGFGFVEMGSSDAAKEAIEKLNGFSVDGRELKVSEDRNAKAGDGGRPGGRSSFGSRPGGFGGPGGGQQMGYFRAQPLDLGLKKKKKADPFVEDKTLFIDYKDPQLLLKFMSERGRILPRRMTGLCAMRQRQVKKAIKRAQHLALLPYQRA